MRNILQKIFRFLRKLRKKNSEKPRKTHSVSCAKLAQKFAKKNLHENSANFAQKNQPFRGNPKYLPSQLQVFNSMEIYSWRKIGKIFLMKCSAYEILSWICPRKKIIWIQKSELVMRILRSITYLHHKINRFSMSCEVANKMLYCNFLPLWKSSSANNLRLKKLMIPNTSKRKK